MRTSTYNNGELFVQEYDNGGANIIVNRPKNLHAIDTKYFSTTLSLLQKKKHDVKCRFIIISSASSTSTMHVLGKTTPVKTRALCAGGDVKQLTLAMQDDMFVAYYYLGTEYSLNLFIAQFGNPTIAMMDGIVMGGGAGISAPCKYRIVTEETRWAMPECAIGFYPDVGLCYYLSRLKSISLGCFLGMTGYNCNAAETLFCGLATHYIPQSKHVLLMDRLIKCDGSDGEIKHLLDNMSCEPTTEHDNIKNKMNVIESCFKHDSLESIIKSLESCTDHVEFCQQTLDKLKLYSPTALRVTLKCIRDARYLSIDQCIRQNYNIACNYNHLCGDFIKGVRAKLIDKTNNYNWDPPVSNIDAFFEEFKSPPFETWSQLRVICKL